MTFNATNTPALASLTSGSSATVSNTIRVTAPTPKGPTETDAQYLARLGDANKTTLSATVAASASNTAGTVTAPTPPATSTSEHVPIVGITKTGPTSARAGTTQVYNLALVNNGSTSAGPMTVADTLPGGASGTVTGVPTSLTAGQLGQATASYPIPVLTAAGGLTDVASVGWSDSNSNTYGPVSSSLTTQVTSFFDGATLTLAPATAGPNPLRSKQNLTATFTDYTGHPISGQSVTFTIAGPNAGTGSATTDPSGVAAFSYPGASSGTDTVTAAFQQGTTTVTSNTSTITWQSLPPVSQDGTAGVLENTPTGIAMHTTSPTGLPLTYRIGTGPNNGAVVIAGNTATYTPNQDYVGPDSFTFIANDGNQDSNTATLALNVTAVNQPPTAGTLTKSALQRLAGDPVQTYFVTEISYGAIAKVSVDSVGHATVQSDFVTGLFGPDSLVFDHHGHVVASDEGSGDISLIDASTGAIINRAVNSTKVPALADLAMDPNSDSVYGVGFRGTGPLGLVKISLTDGTVTALNPDNLGPLGGIAITPDGSRLFVAHRDGVVYEVSPTTGHLLRTAITGGLLDGMVVDPLTGHLFVANFSNISELDLGTAATPGLTSLGNHHSGLLTVDGIAADGQGNILAIGGFSFGGCCLNRVNPKTSTSTEVANSIPSADDVAPVAGAGSPLGTSLSFSVNELIAASTPGPPAESGQHLTVTTVTAAADTHGTATLANGTITFLPDFGFSGSASFSFTVCDDGTTGGNPDPKCANGTVKVTVTPRLPPTTSDSSAVTAENSSVELTPVSASPDGRPVQLLVVTPPAHGTVVRSSSARFTYTPAANYNGPDSFTYNANDGYLESGPSTATITVTPVNQLPTAVAQSKTAVAGQQLTFPATDLLVGASSGPANEASQTLTVTAVAGSATTHGPITLVAGQVTYTSDPTFTGTAAATYIVCDNGTTNGAPDPKCVTAALTFTVGAGPAPTAAAVSATTPENATGTITLAGGSPLGRTLTYRLGTPPTQGSVTISGSTATYTPATNYNGPDTFTYLVNDGLQDSTAGAVAITVTPVNQPPTAVQQVKNATAGVALTFPATGLLAGDSPGPANEASQTLTVTAVTGGPDTHGSLTLAGGQVTYTADATFTGTASASYTICDNGTTNVNPDPKCASAALTFNVSVAPPPPPPPPPTITAQPSQATYPAGQQVAILVTATNQESSPCGLTTHPSSLTVVGVTLNGDVQIPEKGGIERNKKPSTSGTFSMQPTGGAVSTGLASVADSRNPGRAVLRSENLGTGRLELWTVSQPGQYVIQVSYSADRVPWGGVVACSGQSNTISVNFVVSATAATTFPAATTVRSASASLMPGATASQILPTYIIPTGTARAPAEACWGKFTTPILGDPASVLADLDKAIAGLPGSPPTAVGFTITIDDSPKFGNPKQSTTPTEGRGSDESGASIYNINADLDWDTEGYFNLGYVYAPSSPAVTEDICATLYHELAHIRDALILATASPAYLGPNGADDALTFQCTTLGLRWPIQAGEAEATGAENSYRQFHSLPLRVSHDIQGLAYLPPFTGYVWVLQGICDQPLPPLYPLVSFTEP